MLDTFVISVARWFLKKEDRVWGIQHYDTDPIILIHQRRMNVKEVGRHSHPKFKDRFVGAA